MKSDSTKYWSKYLTIAGSRKDSLNLINYLSYEEREEMIPDSVNYWQINKKKAIERERIELNRIDSLQNIIHPIDLQLPFGPKPLGDLIKNDDTSVRFILKMNGSIADSYKQNRKLIFDIWNYYLPFHNYAEEESDGKRLPPIVSHRIIQWVLSVPKEFQNMDPNDLRFQKRISNIEGYEVYYATTDINLYDSGCSLHYRKEADCCFSKEGFACNGMGFIVLYDRTKKEATIVPAYSLTHTNSLVMNLQFFYIEKKTIHIFQGHSAYGQFVTESGHLSQQLILKNGDEVYSDDYKSVGIAKTHQIEIKENGSIIFTEECLPKQNLNPDFHTKEHQTFLANRSKTAIEHYNEKRDSILPSIKPFVSGYPFGLSISDLSSEPIKKINNSFKAEIDNDYGAIDSIYSHFGYPRGRLYIYETTNGSSSFFTLPLIHDTEKIEIGPFESWSRGLLQNFQKVTECSNIEFDGDDISDIKLPPIANYQVYYSSFMGKGILTLYDAKTKKAQIINVLDLYNESHLRFFKINENNEIEIYQGVTSSKKSKKTYLFSKTHIIKINTNGTISATPVNP